jgi:leader peptidase (prepilin peptidase)/N-methyltransferase
MIVLTLLFAFVFGAVIGSFLNVLIVRIPKGENIAFPPSHCPTCDHALKWHHNIPLLSWIVLKGRCAFCQSPISRLYPTVELITGLLYATVALKTGLGAEWLVVSTVFALLLALSVIDFKYYAVPDSLNIAALALALLAPLFDLAWHTLLGDTGPFAPYQTALWHRFVDAAITVVVGVGAGLVVA